MILVDYSAVAFGNITSQKLAPDPALIRHTIINSLRAYYVKFKKKYGEMVICCDHSNWRREVFPYYKWSRRQDRESTPAEKEYWDAVFEIVGQIRDDLKEFFPWRVVHLYGAEGDDVIATLALSTLEPGQQEDTVIVASDSDYKQLLKHSHIKQYCTRNKKFVKPPADIDFWLFEGICKGQGGKDGIPNILSEDNFYEQKALGKAQRMSPVSAKKVQAWYKSPNLEGDMGQRVFRNYTRNRRLIDFAYIPEDIKQKILDQFKEAPKDSRRLLTYLTKHRLVQLIEKRGDFV